ncbi:selenium cofactor biosynthesis protein YqeC [Haladaptatus salinisoli]|uniref:selenium cofactor biosynthesis protein YqeC n=1 Tax=Haladaptatus salinisoli TaxID=2884876 RepID=UPI001D09DC8B|nr:selenium cofactor biosynthesis protein YqeC [Haladaptatus salinisoli]
MDLVEALAAETGTVCAVGAGGKKSTLYALAARAERAVVTATVRIPDFDRHVDEVVVTEDPVAALREADAWPLGLVPRRDRADRYEGYDAETVAALAAESVATVTLVKADGARMCEFKAPGDREPQIPPSAGTVLPIASARVVGKPLTDERVHRPERVAAITGLSEGDVVRAEDVAAVLADERGGRKGVPDGATVIPVVNKVDDGALESVAREIADEVLRRADVPRVALTRMADDEPLVDVVD